MNTWAPFILMTMGWAMITQAGYIPHVDEFGKTIAMRLSDTGIGLVGGGLTMLIPRAHPPAVVPQAVVQETLKRVDKEMSKKDPANG